MHPWSWGRVKVRDGCCIRGLVGHPWRSMDGWRRSMRGEGDGVRNLWSEGVGVEDAVASVVFQGCSEIPALFAPVIP